MLSRTKKLALGLVTVAVVVLGTVFIAGILPLPILGPSPLKCLDLSTGTNGDSLADGYGTQDQTWQVVSAPTLAGAFYQPVSGSPVPYTNWLIPPSSLPAPSYAVEALQFAWVGHPSIGNPNNWIGPGQQVDWIFPYQGVQNAPDHFGKVWPHALLAPPGTYIYERPFTIPWPNAFVIVDGFAADNIVDLYLDQSPTAFGGYAGFNQWGGPLPPQPVSGPNHVLSAVVVNNADTQPNTGLIVRARVCPDTTPTTTTTTTACVDLGTGTKKPFVADLAGQPDPHWQVLGVPTLDPTNAPPAGSYAGGYPWLNPLPATGPWTPYSIDPAGFAEDWVGGTNNPNPLIGPGPGASANWIFPYLGKPQPSTDNFGNPWPRSMTAPPGDYVYQIQWGGAPGWTITFQGVSADNTLTLSLDNNPPFATYPQATTWQNLHAPPQQTIMGPGQHTLTAVVHNNGTPDIIHYHGLLVIAVACPIVTTTTPPLGQAEICVSKFNDADGDGVNDGLPNEPLLPGWTIQITDPAGNLITSFMTGPSGSWCVGVPAPVTYTVSEVLQPGWTQTFPGPPGTHTVSASGGNLYNFEFGNTKTTTTTTTGKCDLQIRKNVSPNPVQTGQQVTITLTVMNVGTADCPPGPFPGTVVRDNQPPGLSFGPPFSYTNPPGWQCGYEVPTPNFTCATQNTLPLGYVGQFTITATVTAPAGTIITNCATVTNQNDMNTSNNQSCVNIQVIGTTTGNCDLTIHKTVDPNPPIAGQPAAFLITVQNVGTAPCTGTTTVTDTLPPGFTPGNVNAGSGWSCAGTTTLICTTNNPISPGPPSTVVVILFTAPPPTGALIQNCASVSNSMDSISGNNQDCINFTIGSAGNCDLSITKTISPNPVGGGQQVTIQITVTNVGTASCPPGTGWTDPQPNGLIFLTPPVPNQPGWQCSLGGCSTNLTLPPGYNVQFTFTGAAAIPPGGTLGHVTNCATVNNPSDVNPGNNQSCVTLTVTPPPPSQALWQSALGINARRNDAEN